MGERQTIDVEKLIADEENPRFEAVSTEDDALFSILEDQSLASGNKILNLARDIAANGLNASELLVVSPIEGTDTYRVREGNRRVTAIKLSLHTDRIPERFASLAPQFRELSEPMRDKRLINCYVSNDEDEIRGILKLRHGGESGGVGTVKWNAAQTARFSQEGNSQTTRALSLVEHLKERFGDNDIWRTAAAIPPTNLGRFISTPEVRQTLGITMNGADTDYQGEHDDLLLAVLATIKDKGVGPIYSKESRIKLVEDTAKRVEPDGPWQPRLVFDGNADEDRDELPGFGPEEPLPEHTYSDEVSLPTSGEIDSDWEFEMRMGTDSVTAEHEQAPEVSHSPNPTDCAQPTSEAADTTKRRKPVSRDSVKKMFGHKLRPRGSGSNNLYRGIEWIDAQYLKDPEGLGHLLPILGFSLRLLVETVAREYYASVDDDKGDRVLASFLKDVAKPAIRSKLNTTGRNNLALASEWIDGSNNFEALLGKWAHGTLAVDRAALVRQSELVALIIDEVWT